MFGSSVGIPQQATSPIATNPVTNSDTPVSYLLGNDLSISTATDNVASPSNVGEGEDFSILTDLSPEALASM